MSPNANLSHRSRNIIVGLKAKKDHKTFDGALKEVIMRSDIDEEHLIEVAKQEGVFRGKEEDEEENNNQDSTRGVGKKYDWGIDDE